MTLRIQNAVALFLMLLIGLADYAAVAQTIHFQTETRSKLHLLGEMSRLIGNKPQVSNAYMSKDYMLDKGDRDATLFSLADKKISIMDLKKKTYYDIGFDEMMSLFEASMQGTQQEIEDSQEEMPEVEFDLSVEDMGETGEFAGFKADRKLMRIEMKFTAEQTDAEGDTEVSEGTFYTLIDMWVSDEVKGYEVMNAYAQNYAESIGESFSPQNGGFAGIAQMMEQDPRIGPAMERAQKEIQKIEGLTLKSTSYFIIGPPDQELDVAAVLGSGERQAEEKKKKRKGRLGQLARGALRQQGVRVGGDNSDAQESGEITEQKVLVETETIYKIFEVIDDDPELFRVPSNFKEIEKPY